MEFSLRFGCDVPTYIDQGIRFEVDAGGSDSWEPVRFYTASLRPVPVPTPPTTSSSEGGDGVLVRLFPNNSVQAFADAYDSFLPLVHLNSSRRVVLREYLCGKFVSALRDQGRRVRFRWMQRYTTNPGVDIATWFLDEVNVRVWTDGCFVSVLNESFSNDSSLEGPGGGISYNVLANSMRVVENSCNNSDDGDDSEGGTALYFNQIRDGMNTVFRRSLVIRFNSVTLGSSCEEEGTLDSANAG